jgi:EAL domain-containing protein (putative c-di-GMP-specific phosphodiesterase class I)
VCSSDLNSNPRHHLIVETIAEFAHKIGTKTIAEFVSDEETYAIVQKIGINYSQGYFTGKPQILE